MGTGGGRGIMEGTKIPNYESFLRGGQLVYLAQRALSEQLNVALTLQHINQGARDSPHMFSAKLTVSYGRSNEVSWTSKRSNSGPYSIAKERGFGDFFPYLFDTAAEHVHALMGKGWFSQHELRGCLHNIEAQVIGDFCISTSTKLRPEVIKRYF